jgi:hypothetical protein
MKPRPTTAKTSKTCLRGVQQKRREKARNFSPESVKEVACQLSADTRRLRGHPEANKGRVEIYCVRILPKRMLACVNAQKWEEGKANKIGTRERE